MEPRRPKPVTTSSAIKQNIVLGQHLLDGGPVAFGRRHDAAGAEDGLADEGGDGFRSLGQDQLLQLGRAVLGEVLLALGRVLAAEVVGRFRVQDRRPRQVEGLVEELQAGQGAGHDAGAVIAAPARDDLLFLRPAQHVVVVPDQLDVGLVGVRAREAEIDPAHARGRALDDHLRQFDGRLAAVADIGVIVGELMGLLGDGLGDLACGHSPR